MSAPRTLTKAELAKLGEDIAAAKLHAVDVDALNKDDGGSCNADSPTLVGLRFTAGLKALLGEFVVRSRGAILIPIDAPGMAARRTRYARAVSNFLRERGWPASMFYLVN